MMRALYSEVLQRIQRLNFEALWPGFHTFPFALYHDERVFFELGECDWNQQFVGNTAIPYEDSYLAIWRIQEEDEYSHIDMDLLAADFVHEMFHAFQFSNDYSGFPEDLDMLFYPLNPENFKNRIRENRALLASLEAPDQKERTCCLRQYTAMRLARAKKLGWQIRNEYLLETLEGTAVFVQLMALKQLSEDKFLQEFQALATAAATPAAAFFSRGYSYHTGAALLLAMKKLGIPSDSRLADGSQSAFEALRQVLFGCSASESELWINEKPDESSFWSPKDEELIQNIIAGLLKQRQEKINSAVLRLHKKTSGDFFISGYDPINMFRLENMILCSNFVRLTEERTGESFLLLGEILLDMKPGSSKQVFAYYQ